MKAGKYAPPPEEHSEESEELWLISYSDLMTLMFGFFVLMYVFALKDTKGQVMIKQELIKYFGGTYAPPYKELKEAVSATAKKFPVLDNAIVAEDVDGIEITFRSTLLFEVGQSELVPAAKDAIKTLATVLSKQAVNSRILVSGHTDDAPINTAQYPSNWELSAARAATVVRLFLAAGVAPGQLAAIGFAESRPAFPNRDKDGSVNLENRQLNRRVVIKVVEPPIVPTPPSDNPE